MSKLPKGGLVVTDGSNSDSGGPRQFSKFYHNRDIGICAKDKAEDFEYEGREFACIGYIGEKYGPTLVWQVMNG